MSFPQKIVITSRSHVFILITLLLPLPASEHFFLLHQLGELNLLLFSIFYLFFRCFLSICTFSSCLQFAVVLIRFPKFVPEVLFGEFFTNASASRLVYHFVRFGTGHVFCKKDDMLRSEY